MKSTYKLYGVFWDKKPAYEGKYNVYLGEVLDYNEEYQIFDIDSYNRSINLTELLNINDIKEINPIILKLNKCDNVILKIDYQNKNNIPIVQNFLNKRISQIYYYLLNELKNSKVYISQSYVKEN